MTRLEKILFALYVIGVIISAGSLFMCLFIDLPKWMLLGTMSICLPYIAYSKITGRDL